MQRRCGSAADVHASLLAGTAVRCSRLMARRCKRRPESGWQFAATMARRVASEPSMNIRFGYPLDYIRLSSLYTDQCYPIHNIYNCNHYINIPLPLSGIVIYRLYMNTHNASIGLRTPCPPLLSTWVYIMVVLTFLCPNSS